jgi:hypothetical protein
MSEVPTSAFDGPLAEFAALRQEILQTRQIQWNVFAFQLTAVAVIFSFSLSDKSRTGFLLIIPVISYTLGTQYMRYELRMQRIHSYIHEDLGPRVPGGFRWQEWRSRNGSCYLSFFARLGFVAPYPMIFPAASACALLGAGIYIWSTGHFSSVDQYLLAAIWFASLIFTAVSIITIAGSLPHRVLRLIRPIVRGSRGGTHN